MKERGGTKDQGRKAEGEKLEQTLPVWHWKCERRYGKQHQLKCWDQRAPPPFFFLPCLEKETQEAFQPLKLTPNREGGEVILLSKYLTGLQEMSVLQKMPVGGREC